MNIINHSFFRKSAQIELLDCYSSSIFVPTVIPTIPKEVLENSSIPMSASKQSEIKYQIQSFKDEYEQYSFLIVVIDEIECLSKLFFI